MMSVRQDAAISLPYLGPMAKGARPLPSGDPPTRSASPEPALWKASALHVGGPACGPERCEFRRARTVSA